MLNLTYTYIYLHYIIKQDLTRHFKDFLCINAGTNKDGTRQIFMLINSKEYALLTVLALYIKEGKTKKENKKNIAFSLSLMVVWKSFRTNFLFIR